MAKNVGMEKVVIMDLMENVVWTVLMLKHQNSNLYILVETIY